MNELSSRAILLPDHVGGWIERAMKESALNVQILPTKRWVELSPNVKVMCLPDYNQDATLLIAIGSALIVNFNDGAALGYRRFIKNLSKNFSRRYLLAPRNYGDPDMINLWDGSEGFLTSLAAEKPSIGAMYEKARRIVPRHARHTVQLFPQISAQGQHLGSRL